MAEFVHPDLNSVPLSAALHALADPVRLHIVEILAKGDEMNCEAAAAGLGLAKSTQSNHFKVLRTAGLVKTRKAGRDYLNSLRRDEMDARFPGLLASVLGVLATEEPSQAF